MTKKETNKAIDNKKLELFRDAMAKVSKEMKSTSPVGIMNEIFEDIERITTGSIVLDSIIGGGFPVGRIIEIYGENASGKTSIALTALGELQKKGGTGVFIDAEQAFDPTYARKLGVDTSKMGFTQSIVAEEIFTQIELLAKSGTVDLIIVDSIASIIPLEEFNAEIGKNTIALRARVLSSNLPKLANVASKNKCTLIFLNQTRTNVGVMYGDPTVTAGGKALPYTASMRIKVSKATKPVEVDGVKIGTTVKFQCVKNKVAQPYGVGETVLTFNEGFDTAAETLFVAEKYNVLQKEGRTYRYKTDKKIDFPEGVNSVYESENVIKLGSSKADVLEELRVNKPLSESINKDIQIAISKALETGEMQANFSDEA